MVLVSGGNRLDEKKLAALCGVGRKQIHRSNADSAREVTGYAIGGIPPFGHVTPLPTYVDTRFAASMKYSGQQLARHMLFLP